MALLPDASDRRDEAREAYERALPFADNEQVRRFIELRLRSQ
jgi:predicted RNA polymerase sigma factor